MGRCKSTTPYSILNNNLQIKFTILDKKSPDSWGVRPGECVWTISGYKHENKLLKKLEIFVIEQQKHYEKTIGV